MFNFFKKKSKYPPFRILTNFHKRHAYFLRNAEWSQLDESSTLVTEPVQLTVLTLQNWQQYIFLSAIGEQTVEQFVYAAADKITPPIPYSLDQTIIFELLALERKGIIVFADKKQPLPKEFELPGMGGLK